MSDFNRGGLSLAEIKEEIFDPVLAKMIYIRVVHGAQITEYFRYRPIVDELTPVLHRLINPALLDSIVNRRENPQFNVDSLKRKIYVPEDQARSCLRKIVEIEHGIRDMTLVRSVTESCMNLLLRLIHSKEFAAELAGVLAPFDIDYPPRPPKRPKPPKRPR